jgi:Tfp pilus assembly protein PilO
LSLGRLVGAAFFIDQMNQPMQLWTMLFAPAATLLGTMLIVMLGVYLQNRSLERAVDLLRAEIGTLRAEFKQQLAELELRLTKQIMELAHRVERLEETRGLIRTP